MTQKNLSESPHIFAIEVPFTSTGSTTIFVDTLFSVENQIHSPFFNAFSIALRFFGAATTGNGRGATSSASIAAATAS